jgi:hypothetical protein
MKPLFVLVILAALVNSALGQQSGVPATQKCSLTLAQSPAIRGLKLGMNVDEVLQQFPGTVDEPHVRNALSMADKEFGVARFGVTTRPAASDSRFAGIYGLSFEFLDRRLSSIWVQYAGPEWRNVDEFISRLSAPLNLPGPISWEPANVVDQKTLKCAGFEIRAHVGGATVNSLLLRNPAVDQIVKDRQAEVKERARQAFRP